MTSQRVARGSEIVQLKSEDDGQHQMGFQAVIVAQMN
jgi:hypothetical protein